MISIKEVWHDAEADHEAYVTGHLSTLLEIEEGQAGRLAPAALHDFISRNKESFATGDVDTLRGLIADASATLAGLPNDDARSAFLESAKKVFNYDRFCAKTVHRWSAYKLCEKARNSICPYCNQAFAFTVVGTTTSYRPTLDHFYFKDNYPYLALSLYNLVPSCYVCNSSLKGTKNFFTDHHLHPLEDDDEIRFDLRSTDGNYTFADLLHDDNLLNEYGYLEPHPHSNKAINSIETFLLKERFELNLPAIKRFIRLRKKFRPSKIAQYRQWFGEDFDTAEYLQFEPVDYKNQMLGKILLDMYVAFDPEANGSSLL